MARRAVLIACALFASSAVAACFDWAVGTVALDGGVPDASGDVGIVDATANDADASLGDSAIDADAMTFECPFGAASDVDSGQTSCVLGKEQCCDTAGTWGCSTIDAGCSPSYACSTSKECPFSDPICCYSGGGGPNLGSSSCASKCVDQILCKTPSDCTALDAGTTCGAPPISNPPPEPYRSCLP